LRHLRVPPLLVAIISFMYRYLFVLADEAMRLLRARDSRSASLPGSKSGSTVTWRARIAGNMAGQLFVRSFERSDKVYNAMVARGYTGHFLTLNPHLMRATDWAVGMGGVIVLLLIQLIGRVSIFS
jgi:cobalt/nickel transport system permease protein